MFPRKLFSTFRRISTLHRFSTNVGEGILKKLSSLRSDELVHLFHEDGVAILAMNFQAKRNALSKSFVSALSDAVTELEVDTNSRIAILCSTVPDVFCAGADLAERATVADKHTPLLVSGLRALFHRIYLLPMPIVAALDGAALGGGLELALACDVRYAGVLPSCTLGLVETHWALLPGAGGSQRLPRLIGEAKAKELMYAASRFSAIEAVEYGVVNAAIQPTSVPEVWKKSPALYNSVQYAGKVITKGPIAVRQLKRAVIMGLGAGSLEAGLNIEGQCYRALVPTADRKEGMAAFREKREPLYKGC